MSDCNELFFRFPGFKTKAVTLSYDDGYADDRKMVSVLNDYGIKCTFNINTGKVEGNSAKVQFDEFEELYCGHEVACHTFTHPFLDFLDLGSIAYQIMKDREKLEEVMHRPVEGLAYPYGLDEIPGMIDCVRSCGIRYGRATNATHKFHLPTDYLRWNPTCHQGDPELFKLAEEFLMPDDTEHPWRIRPQLFFIWGHSYEFGRSDTWNHLERICQTLGKKDNVWYATNGDIIDYISAFRALRRSVNSKYIYNPTNTDVYVSVGAEKDILLEKGKLTSV